jgi:hypothetical protein
MSLTRAGPRPARRSLMCTVAAAPGACRRRVLELPTLVTDASPLQRARAIDALLLVRDRRSMRPLQALGGDGRGSPEPAPGARAHHFGTRIPCAGIDQSVRTELPIASRPRGEERRGGRDRYGPPVRGATKGTFAGCRNAPRATPCRTERCSPRTRAFSSAWLWHRALGSWGGVRVWQITSGADGHAGGDRRRSVLVLPTRPRD